MEAFRCVNERRYSSKAFFTTSLFYFSGAVDGKHVLVQYPELSGSQFYNYKGTFSTVLLAVADPNYCFTYVDVGAYGSQHDSTILSNSSFGQRMEAGELNLPTPRGDLPYVFVGDEAFQLHQTIMRPYPEKSIGTPRERLKRIISIICPVAVAWSKTHLVYLLPGGAYLGSQ